MQKRVNLVDLVKSFQTSIYMYLVLFTSIYYLLAKFGFDTAENGPLKVCQKLANSWKKVRIRHRLKHTALAARMARLRAAVRKRARSFLSRSAA